MLQRHLIPVWLLLTMGPWAAAQAQVQFPVPMPRPTLGDISVFKTIDLWNNTERSQSRSEVVEVTKDNIVLRSTSSTRPEPTTLRYTAHWGPCRSLQNSTEVICAGALNFPMNVGGKHAYTRLPWPDGRGHSSGDCVVKQEEKVTTAPGVYETVVIECTGYYNRVVEGSFSGRQRELYWYAPSIGRVIKSEFYDFDTSGRPFNKTRTELVEFIPGK